MLIRWATHTEREAAFQDLGEYEVLTAVNRMSGLIHGMVGFNRKEGRLVRLDLPSGRADVAALLLKCAERQLHPRGKSFHYRYPNYAANMLEECCPCSDGKPFSDEWLTVARMEYGFVRAERIAQGRLWGKCHVNCNKHYVHLYELPPEELAGFMGDVAKTAKALQQITGAVKINYEIHGNTAAHLHCHLFPRYLDDDFPGAGIDVNLTEPSPYESEEEFVWFVESLRNLLANN